MSDAAVADTPETTPEDAIPYENIQNKDSAGLIRPGSKKAPETHKSPYGLKATLSIFMLVNFISYYDRGAIAGALTTIKKDTDISSEPLSDTEAGAVVSAFMVGFMVFSPIFAGLGGLVRPCYTVSAGLLVWIAACISTSLSGSYAMLVASRCFVGIGEAAYCGYIPTMIDDMAPLKMRTFYIGMYFAMIPVGTAAGMAAGGIFSDASSIMGMKGWKFLFFSESLLMIPLIFLIARLPQEMGRGRGTCVDQTKLEVSQQPSATSINTKRSSNVVSSTSVPTSPHSTTSNASWSVPPSAHISKEAYPTPFAAVLQLLQNPQYMFTTLGYGMYTFVLGGVAAWGITFLQQSELQMDQAVAAASFGMVTAVTGITGTSIGGWYVDHIGGSKGEKGMTACHKFNIAMTVISVPAGLLSFMFTEKILFFLLCSVAEFALFTTTAPVNSVVMESVPENMRVYAMSFTIFIIHGVGDFPSPILVGAVSDHFSQGCSDYDDADNKTNAEILCNEADSDKHCFWVDKVCRNDTQLRNAMLFVFALLALAPIFWCVALALLRAKKVRGYEAIGDSDSSDDEAGNDPVLIKNAAFEDGEAPSE